MSCPIHDRCTCYAASLHYTTSVATATGSSQVIPQANNVFVGYEWAAPIVPTSAAWYPFESVLIPPTLHSTGSTHGTVPLHNSYHPEPRVYERQQKLAPPPREQFATQHPYPSPYIQGSSRMSIPSNHSDMLVQAHRRGTYGYGNYNGYSTISPDQSMAFDEPPPPYRNNFLPVSPMSDALLQSALLTTASDRPLSVGQITPSPLTPVPLRHSSLYQVLKHDSPGSPVLGTLQSGVSSLAHALELQELPPREARTPVFGKARSSTIGASETAFSAGQTSLVVVAVDPCHPLPHGHTLAISAQAQSPVSPATPPCASQNGSVVTPTQSHTLVESPPEVATQDYDTFPRLRKSSRLIQLQLPGSAKEDQSAPSPLSPVSSRPSSSMGAPASSPLDGEGGLESAFAVPLLGRKRPVLRAKLACLFCRRRKIQCRLSPGDQQGSTCQQCAKRCRKCEYPEMTWRGRLKKRSRDGSDDDDFEEDPPSRSTKSRRASS